MEIVKINLKHPDSRVIKKAGEVLRRGGVIVYPTDTAYALGCDVTNKSAMADVFKIKERPLEKALPLIAGSVAMVKKFCKIDKISARLMKKYWPGPLTLVLSIKYNVSSILRKNKTIAVRVPDCKIARLLSLKLGRPIVSTSANLSGRPSCYSVACVLRQFKIPLNPPDGHRGDGDSPFGKGSGRRPRDFLILDAGPLLRQKPSTIAKIVGEEVVIIRQGGIKL